MTDIRKAPSGTNRVRVDLEPDKFDSFVHDKGSPVILESAIKCPCKLDGRSNIPSCVNCGGIGYVFINPIETRMVLQSMNMGSKMGQWSLERIGLVNITTRSVDVLSDMDRITLKESVSKISQVVFPKFHNNQLFAFVNYNIIKVIDVFQFQAEDKKLKKVPEKDYTVAGNKVILNKSSYKDDITLTIRYTHNIQYFVIDIPREIRQSPVLKHGTDKLEQFPVSGVGRRCHYVFKPDDFAGSSIVDNSYDK